MSASLLNTFRFDYFEPAARFWDVVGHILPLTLITLAAIHALFLLQGHVRGHRPITLRKVQVPSALMAISLVLLSTTRTEGASSLLVDSGKIVVEYRYRASAQIPLEELKSAEYVTVQRDFGRRGKRMLHRLVIKTDSGEHVIQPLTASSKTLSSMKEAEVFLRQLLEPNLRLSTLPSTR